MDVNINENPNLYDSFTNKRISIGSVILVTDVANVFKRNSRAYKVIEEDTVVWLAEALGFTLIRNNEGDSGNAEVVDGEDAGVGAGTVEVGEVKAGGKSTAKRRSSGTVKGK